MSQALSTSFVVLPETDPPFPSILEFLTKRFDMISPEVWYERIASGKVMDTHGKPVSFDTAYIPRTRLYYYREVSEEPLIPFDEKILYKDDHLLVADKPHFLPVIPAGPYVNECLLNRLKKKTGIDSMTPLHRIDKETAGIVMFSCNPETRGQYQALFINRAVQKEYEAVTHCPSNVIKQEWQIESRIVRGEPFFRMKIVNGTINARTKITLLEIVGEKALFRVIPLTGKKHQVRLHLCAIGCPIVNDRKYPELLPEQKIDFSKTLLLLAKRIVFKDPIAGTLCEFESEGKLDW